MMKIQKKSLQHVSNTLKSFDTFLVYRALSDAMTEAGIDNKTSMEIIEKYKEAINKEEKKVTDAKDWIDTIISDIE